MKLKRREQPRMTLRLKPLLYEALERLAERDERSMQQLAERAIQNYLRSRGVEVDR